MSCEDTIPPGEGPVWRLERHVTLGVVIAMALQAAAALVWFGATGERIEQLERRADVQSPVLERLARLEEGVGRNQAALARIEGRMDVADSSLWDRSGRE